MSKVIVPTQLNIRGPLQRESRHEVMAVGVTRRAGACEHVLPKLDHHRPLLKRLLKTRGHSAVKSDRCVRRSGRRAHGATDAPVSMIRVDGLPEIRGPADQWLRERIEAFLVALERDPWGSERPARIAIAEDREHLDELMRTHLSSKDYETWAFAQTTNNLQLSMARACLAPDGLKTVLAIVPDHALAIDSGRQKIELLSNVCHKICHTTMVGLDEGDTAPTVHHAARRLIWSEHIVERRREAVFRNLGWEGTPYDRLLLTSLLVRHYKMDAPRLLKSPNEPRRQLEMHWLNVLNEYVTALGRARSGATAEARGIAKLLSLMPDARRALWAAVDAAADETFESPTATRAELDLIADRAWQPLHQALNAEFAIAYAAHAPLRQQGLLASGG
jgi:hypothetical protein